MPKEANGTRTSGGRAPPAPWPGPWTTWCNLRALRLARADVEKALRERDGSPPQFAELHPRNMALAPLLEGAGVQVQYSPGCALWELLLSLESLQDGPERADADTEMLPLAPGVVSRASPNFGTGSHAVQGASGEAPGASRQRRGRLRAALDAVWLREMVRQGFSGREIADKLGWPHRTVARRLKELADG